MHFKRLRVQLKDLFVEMRDEKQKLLKEIQLLKDFRNCLNSFVNCCKCDQNVINGNKFIANQLENQYLTSFPTNLVINKPHLDKISHKLAKEEKGIQIIDICGKDNVFPINGFVEDEVIINENILDIDCRQLCDDYIIREVDVDSRQLPAKEHVQMEIIPKIEVEERHGLEIIDLEAEMTERREEKFKDLEFMTNGSKNVFNIEETNDISMGRDPKKCQNMSYLSSFVSQIKNSEEMNSIANFNANNITNSGKTIVVERNMKIYGFVCNIDNCKEFYKTITGLQSHIDRVHNRSQSVVKPLPNGKQLTFYQRLAKKSTTMSKGGKISRRKSDQNKVVETNVKIIPLVDRKDQPKSNRLKNTNKFVCEEQNCRFSCGTKYQLISHKISKHKNGRHFRCKRPDCRLIFKSKSDVIQHLRKHSINTQSNESTKGLELRFKCGFKNCNGSYETRALLKKHKIESKHIETVTSKQNVVTKDVKCPTKGCERTFKSQFALNTHLRFARHTILKTKVAKLARPNVPKAVTNDKNTQKQQFICRLDNCGKHFNSRFSLKQHIKKCGQKSVVLFSRSKEVFYSVKNPSSRHFKCANTDCKAVFKHRFGLNQHMKCCPKGVKSSIGTKQFQCEILGCRAQFSSYVSVKCHIKSFHKLPPLKCRVKNCNSRFYSCSQKTQHFKDYHCP